MVPVTAGLDLVRAGAEQPAAWDIEQVLPLRMADHRVGRLAEDTGGDHRAVL